MTEKEHIGAGFFTLKHLQGQEIATKLLQTLYEKFPEFAPEYFDDNGKHIHINYVEKDNIIKTWTKSENVLLLRHNPYPSEIALSMKYISAGFNTLNLWVAEEYFSQPSSTTRFLTLCLAIYDLIEPVYGAIHSVSDSLSMSTVNDIRYGKTIVPVNLKKGLPGIYWANFFGPKYVEFMTRQKINSVRSYQNLELSDGGYLMITAESPLQVDPDELEKIKTELGQQFFYKWQQSIPSLVPSFTS
jgi:hypothetical protein